MQMQPAAVELAVEKLIKPFEGLVLHPYDDGTGVWTIGYGTTRAYGQPVNPHTPNITTDQATSLLMNDVRMFVTGLEAVVKVFLLDYQWAALLSFVYNLGLGNFRGSTLLKYINEQRWGEAADEFPKWCHAGGHVLEGLVRRRAAERAMFVEGRVP